MKAADVRRTLVRRALDSEPDISQLGLAVTHDKLKFVGHYLRTGAHLQRKLHRTGGGGAFSGIDWRGGVRTDVRNECAACFRGYSTNSEVSRCSPPRR